MVNSLVLSHLPHTFTYKDQKILAFIKDQSEAPTAAALADRLLEWKKGLDSRHIWETLHTARRMAELTANILGKNGIFAVNFWSRLYPLSLRLIHEPPWNLFFIGALPAKQPTLAVVGSRRPNSYGVRLINSFIPELTTRPLQIVSGLAYGIDSLAHFYACESSIPNFAVLGSGVDVLYPQEHHDLAARIVAGGGGILSEFPPGTPPYPSHFPRRNRIVSALADVVWVVQGTMRSGSLHTAKHALEQAKTVAACPCDVFSELSQVPNRLIFDGAQTILRPDDLDLLLAKPPATITH